MPTFTMGKCEIKFAVEPLSEPLSIADRELAWRAYLALRIRPGLRRTVISSGELSLLIDDVRLMLQHWPGAQVTKPKPGHLGYLLLSVIECVLMPALGAAAGGVEAAPAVVRFCAELAQEIGVKYGFGSAVLSAPADLITAFEIES